MEIKRKDLVTVWAVLESLRTAKTNIRTTYTIAKNRNLVQPEMEAIQAATKLDGSLLQYEQARVKLCQDLAVKDANGNPLTENSSFVFDEKGKIEFEAKLKELQTEMPEALEQAKEQDKQLEGLMDETVEIALLSFQLSILPDDLMSVAQLEVLDKYGLISD